jgi:ornithine cyclodeaminase
MTAGWVAGAREALASVDAAAPPGGLVIGAAEARRCAPLPEVIEAVREAVAWEADGRIGIPEDRRAALRYTPVDRGDGLRAAAIVKCCVVPDLGIAGFRFLGSILGDDPVRYLCLAGLAHRRLLATIDEHLTYLQRIAALAVVVAHHTVAARTPTVGVVGAGRLARAVLEALVASDRAGEILVTSRSKESRDALVRVLAEAGVPRVAAAASVEEVAARADFLVTATSATAPVLRAAWVKPGATVYALGDAIELGDDLLVRQARGRVRLVVSNWLECAQRADFRRLIAAGLIGPGDVDAELADVVAGAAPARLDDRDVVCVRAPGSVALDVFVGVRICARYAAIQRGQTRG